MNELRTVGIVGLGRMGLTLAAAFGRAVGPDRLFGSGRSAASVARFEQAAPGARTASARELPGLAELIVLCAPQSALPAVLDELRPRLTADHLVVTISNRQPLSVLAEAVPGPVAKLIPSAGNEIGAGATLLVPGPGMTPLAVEHHLELLRTFSTPFVITEDQGRAATDLASCGPALLAAAAAAMAQAQRRRNAPLPPELAEQLATCSLEAAGRLVAAGASLPDVIDRVAVPGGNTAAGLAAAREGLAAAWRAAFRATEDNERSGHPAH
ncbi:pyrroline-5-carboxylate reductase dimerization domain-containing protein [Kitasatospora sp. NPDC002227]|uniref:pyrroline-5-carboxylate reductase dimerization domain-containing protein n=1 Tax=Kitasatospora sp. NPDC002227 TaxID=3154773 RepID=UPI00331EA5C7